MRLTLQRAVIMRFCWMIVLSTTTLSATEKTGIGKFSSSQPVRRAHSQRIISIAPVPNVIASAAVRETNTINQHDTTNVRVIGLAAAFSFVSTLVLLMIVRRLTRKKSSDSTAGTPSSSVSRSAKLASAEQNGEAKPMMHGEHNRLGNSTGMAEYLSLGIRIKRQPEDVVLTKRFRGYDLESPAVLRKIGALPIAAAGAECLSSARRAQVGRGEIALAVRLHELRESTEQRRGEQL